MTQTIKYEHFIPRCHNFGYGKTAANFARCSKALSKLEVFSNQFIYSTLNCTFMLGFFLYIIY